MAPTLQQDRSAPRGQERRTAHPASAGRPGGRDSEARLKVLMLDPSAATAAVTHNVCNALGAVGCEVDFFTAPYWERSVGRCFTRNYRPRVVFYRHTQSRSYESGNGLSRGLWRAMRLVGHVATMAKVVVLARRFDIVHVQWLPVPPVDALFLWLISRRTPVAYTVHNLLPHDSRKSPSLKALYRMIYRIPKVLFVHTQHTARGLTSDFNVPANRVVQIRHGSMEHLLDLPRNGSDRGARTEASTILFLGQIQPYKGLDTLLRAAARLRSRVRDFRLLVAGRPRVDMAPYIELIRQLDLGDLVELRLGYIEENELPQLFERASVVVFPYRAVDQSGVAVAACTLGRAIVATACGGLEEIVREADNGILVPVEDAGALAHALATVLENDGVRERFEENSSKYARTALSCARIAEQIVAGYDRARDRPPGAP